MKRGALGWVVIGCWLVVPESVSAQTIAVQQVEAEYARVKAAVERRYDELSRSEAKRAASQPRDEYFDALPPVQVDEQLVAVFDCGYTEGLDYAGAGPMEGSRSGSPAWAAVLFHIAKAVTVVKVTAQEFRYPQEVWQPLLAEYEKRGIAHAKSLAGKDIKDADAVMNALPAYPESVIEAMDAYRLRTRKAGPQLVAQEGCGAGETIVEIVAEPAARVIRLIPEFFAMVCEHSGRALNGDACPYWREAPQQSNFNVSGLYRYRVTWSDGVERTGKVDFDKLSDGETTPTFKIKK